VDDINDAIAENVKFNHFSFLESKKDANDGYTLTATFGEPAVPLKMLL